MRDVRKSHAAWAWSRSSLALLCLLFVTLDPHAVARGQSGVYARVMIESAAVRSGPGLEFRQVYLAQRDEVFPIRKRSTRGYYFQIELPDSRLAWIAGDVVYNHEVSEDPSSKGRFWPWLFAPPPLPAASGEVAVTGGVLGSAGLIALKPSVLLDPTFGFEATFAAAVGSGGRLLIVSAGPIVNLFPQSPVVPLLTLQGGVTSSRPNADSFLLDSGAIATATAGIGLRMAFHYRLTLRLEARSHVFFEPDRMLSEEELCAGLTVFY